MRAFSLVLPLYSIMFLLSFIFRGLRKVAFTVLMNKILRIALSLVLIVIFFMLGFRLMGAVLAFCLSVILSVFCGLFLLYRSLPFEFFQVRPAFEYRKLLFFSFPLIVLYFAVNLMNRLDILFLGRMVDASRVGVYSIAARVAHFNFFSYAAFNLIFGPIFADLYNRGRLSEISTLFKTTTRWCFSLTLPCVIVVCVFSTNILSLFGEKFIIGALPLIILSLAWLLISFSGSIGNILVMAG